ncbi:CsbD family protein [Pseudonocardia sp. KRD291]|uniref:CsbD family protein n=1 Tax=Pseudonocardia sp. KRD291 TaxID=2792007 RepID=UPI001C4A60C3|nr:CsbD family protein [Pseudonocardia sp. KRD291]MBW0104701.1 CsbD family protein [Pseudonocardia sp. KRD291]
MGLADKAKNKAQETVGKVKEKAGEATDNDQLVRDGQADQVEAATKQAGEKAKDAAGDVKDKFTEN